LPLAGSEDFPLSCAATTALEISQPAIVMIQRLVFIILFILCVHRLVIRG
jgi:hypothetical protein